MQLGLTDYKEQHSIDDFIAFLNDRLRITAITCTIDEEALAKADQLTNSLVPISDIDVEAIPDFHLMDLGVDLITHFKELIEADLEECETNLHRIKKLLKTENILFHASERFNPDNLWRITQDVKIYYRKAGNVSIETNLGRLVLADRHWDIIKQVFRYRLTLLQEMFFITKGRISDYDLLLKRHRQYQWGKSGLSKNTNEIFELALSLSLSPSLKCINDSSENNFIIDFMSFFNLPMPKASKIEGNIINRIKGNRARFLDDLEIGLEKHADKIKKMQEKKKELARTKMS